MRYPAHDPRRMQFARLRRGLVNDGFSQQDATEIVSFAHDHASPPRVQADLYDRLSAMEGWTRALHIFSCAGIDTHVTRSGDVGIASVPTLGELVMIHTEIRDIDARGIYGPALPVLREFMKESVQTRMWVNEAEGLRTTYLHGLLEHYVKRTCKEKET